MNKKMRLLGIALLLLTAAVALVFVGVLATSTSRRTAGTSDRTPGSPRVLRVVADHPKDDVAEGDAGPLGTPREAEPTPQSGDDSAGAIRAIPMDGPVALAPDDRANMPANPDLDTWRVRIVDPDGKPAAARIWYWPQCVHCTESEHREKYGVPPILYVPPGGLEVPRRLIQDADFHFGETVDGGIVSPDEFLTMRSCDIVYESGASGAGYLAPELADPACWAEWRAQGNTPDICAADVHAVRAHDGAPVAATLTIALVRKDSADGPPDGELGSYQHVTARLTDHGANPVCVLRGGLRANQCIRAQTTGGWECSPWEPLFSNTTLQLHPAARLRLQLLHADGTNVGSLPVGLRLDVATGDSAIETTLATDTDALGRVDLGPVPAGTWNVEVVFDRDWTADPVAEREIQPGTETEIVVAVRQRPTIRVRLRDRGHGLRGSPTVVFVRQPDELRDEPMKTFPWRVDSKPDIELPLPGTWELHLRSPIYGHLTLGPYRVADGERLTVDNDIASLRQSQIRIHFMPKPERRWPFVSLKRGNHDCLARSFPDFSSIPASGEITPSGLEPGDYEVRTWPEAGNASAVGRFRINEDGTATPPELVVTIEPAARLEVAVSAKTDSTLFIHAAIVVTDSNGNAEPIHSGQRTVDVASGEVVVWLRPGPLPADREQYRADRWIPMVRTAATAGATTRVELPAIGPVTPHAIFADKIRIENADDSSWPPIIWTGTLSFLPAGRWRISWTDGRGSRVSRIVSVP